MMFDPEAPTGASGHDGGRTMSEQAPTKDQVYYCSFCGISNFEIPHGILIDAGPAQICNRCVSIAQDIVWSWRHSEWLQFKDLAP